MFQVDTEGQFCLDLGLYTNNDNKQAEEGVEEQKEICQEMRMVSVAKDV